MTDSEHRCSRGLDITQLLAYVEGELDETAGRNLEAHLKQCPFCAREVETLRQMDCLLRERPESLHPGEEALFRLVCQGEDPGGKTAEHLLFCASCNHEADILREMTAERLTAPDARTELPESLRRRLRRTGASTSPKMADGLASRLGELIRLPFRTPRLAIGSAAAILLLVVLGAVTWRSLEHKFVESKAGAPPTSVPDDSKVADSHGSALALYNLGNMYRHGEKVPKDYQQALKWYRKAAEQGFAPAQLALGTMYMDGLGGSPDYNEAVNWYRKAAEQSLAAAQYHLGRMYENGWGVSKNNKEAVKWYRKAAAQGNREAERALARLLEAN